MTQQFCFAGPTILTVAGHADGEAFLEPTILTPVPVEPDDQAFPVSQAPVLDLLLDTPPEEALEKKTQSYRQVTLSAVPVSHTKGRALSPEA
jgi:hypothetical protein